MRAAPVAKAIDAPLIHPEKFSDSGFWDTIVVTKYWPKGIDLRARCDRLVWDPLDAWESTKPDASPANFWRWCHGQLRFDTIIATSPSAAVSMNHAIGEKVRVVLSPHHADPRIDSSWHDPAGPIVYAGGERFIASNKETLTRAAKYIGREIVWSHDRDCWQALKGASLSLCLRLHPTDNEINRTSKPGVKIENAAAAGLCCLASDHPAITSLRPEITVHRGGSWEAALLSAYEAGPLKNPVTIGQHIEIMRGLLS